MVMQWRRSSMKLIFMLAVATVLVLVLNVKGSNSMKKKYHGKHVIVLDMSKTNIKRRIFIRKCCGKFSCSNSSARIKTTRKQLQHSATFTIQKATLQQSQPAPQVWTDTVDPESTTQSNLGETAGTEMPTTDTESTIISTEPTTTEVQTTENIQPLSGLTTRQTTTIPTTTTSAQPKTTTTPWSCRYKCPPHTCEEDATLFNSDGALTVQSNPSSDGAYFFACNRFYFVGIAWKNWNSAAEECCKRKMHMVAFETADEYNCIRDKLFRTTYWNVVDKELWTGATDKCKESQFNWCYKDDEISPVDTSFLNFDPNEPSNDGGPENCLQITNVHNMTISDTSCSTVLPYLCESPEPKSPQFPVCSESCLIRKAEMNVTIETLRQLATNPLILVSDYLAFMTACGSTYIIIVKAEKFGNWQEAQDECCAYGAWAASFSSLEEMQCFAMSNQIANGHMWTSGTNQGVFSEANFGWCSTGYLVPDNMWVSYEGPYDPWARRCVTIRLIKGSPMDSRLENAPCGVKLNSVVCRIPD